MPQCKCHIREGLTKAGELTLAVEEPTLGQWVIVSKEFSLYLKVLG